MILNTWTTHTQNSPVTCDGVQLTNAHGTYIHIIIQRIMNYTFETYIWNHAVKNE